MNTNLHLLEMKGGGREFSNIERMSVGTSCAACLLINKFNSSVSKKNMFQKWAVCGVLDRRTEIPEGRLGNVTVQLIPVHCTY
jgi:hypothetical protein